MITAVPATIRTYSEKRSQLVTVAFMVGLSTMNYFDRTIMAIAGPLVMKEFSISETAMGAVYSAFLLSYTLLMAPSGALADRFGGHRVLSFAGGGAALFTALTAACGRPGLGSVLGVVPSFLLIRFAFGLCTAPLYPSCARMTANWIPVTWQGRVQALIIGGAAVGAASSPLIFSSLMRTLGWRTSFCCAALATLTLTFLWSFLVRERGTGEAVTHAPNAPWTELLKNRNLALLALGYFTVDYFEYIFFYWMYYYLGQIRHMSPSQSANATTILFVTMAIMTPLGGWCSDRLVVQLGPRLGRRLVPVLGMALSAVLLLLGAQRFGFAATVVLLALALGFLSSSEGPYWATAIEVSPSLAGSAGGVLNTFGNVGGIAAPVVTPVIASIFGWEVSLEFASLLVILGLISWFFVRPEEPRDSAAK